MPTVVNIHDASTHLLKLLEKVASAEHFIIASSGKPIALLSPIPQETSKTNPKRKPGFAKGLIPNSDALFDSALKKEIEKLVYQDWT